MATFSPQRLGNGLAVSLEFAARSRSVSLRFNSVAERTRHRAHTTNPFAVRSRQFSVSTRDCAQTSYSPTASSNRPAYSRPAPSPFNRPQAQAAAPPVQTERQTEASAPQTEPLRDISTTGLSDAPSTLPKQHEQVDWTTSFHGLSTESFTQEAQDALLQPLNVNDIEVKPDGIVYLPEIKYRRILNKAFGPGGWGLAPRGETIVTAKSVTREYALVAKGRLVSIARGEQDYFDPEGIPTATEGCKSNALMRCCKDLGVASELWDPRFIRGYLDKHAKEVWVEHAVSKKRKKITMRKDDQVRYPFKETKPGMM